MAQMRAFRDLRFQSTLPARGATEAFSVIWEEIEISIHAPRTGSDLAQEKAELESEKISIHAPRTGSDDYTKPKIVRGNNFNPRSPHGERLDCQSNRVYRSQFQSTLPARGAT